MRIVLIGAVESTSVALRTLVRERTPPVAVVTLPAEKAGRHSDYVDLRPLAGEAGIPVLETPQVNAPEMLAAVRELSPDYLAVIGWSQILGRELIAIPSRGSIGYHPAPLPEMRGRAVIPWTILTRRRATGSTLFWIDEGMDTGDILGQEVFEVARDETARTLYAKHMSALESILYRSVEELRLGRCPRVEQDHSRATVCAKRTADDGVIDWGGGADEVWTTIRALTDPYPGAFTFAGERKLVLWDAELVESAPFIGLPGQVQELRPDSALVSCGRGGFIRIRELQLEGAKRSGPAGVLKLHQRLGFSGSRAPVSGGSAP